MPQVLVLAYDGTDADAPTRTRAARAVHFEQIRPMVKEVNSTQRVPSSTITLS